MTGSTHMVAGATAAVAFYAVASPVVHLPTLLAYMGAGVIGGLLPDIDHPNSKISHKLKPVSKIVNLIFSHRGFFHTPALYLILWMAVMHFCPQGQIRDMLIYLLLGAASHLVLDFLNPGGIPLFFPVDTTHRHLLAIRTGGTVEMCLRTVMCIVGAGLFLEMFYWVLISI